MILSFHPCFSADHQLIMGDRRPGSEEYRLLSRAKAVILPQGVSREFYEFCSRVQVNIFPNYDLRFRYPGKVGQATLFCRYRVPHPETLVWKSVEEFRSQFPVLNRFPFPLPFLIKDNYSHEGQGVYLISDPRTLSSVLECLALGERSGRLGFITQVYVPSEGNVLRVVMVGEKVFSYWKRPPLAGGWFTAVSRGARIDHEWRPEEQERGRQAAARLAKETGINLAAFDLVFPSGGGRTEALFLEVNYYFGRRGMGGIHRYYRILYEAIQKWILDLDLDPQRVKLV